MLVETSKLIGPHLDWAVAKCEGETYSPTATTNGIGMEFPATSYSTDWAQGGPIIEREGMNISIQNDDHGNMYSGKARWWAQMDCRIHTSYGPTPLIAAMRCYVASKLGDEVEIPNELLGD